MKTQRFDHTNTDAEGELEDDLDLYSGEGGNFYKDMLEEVDESDYLLGKGWIERGHGVFVYAPSGVGKSVLSLQASALWCCGREAFDIEPIKPLRILIIQAEDTKNDLRRMAKLGCRLGFSEKEREQLKTNIYIRRLSGPTGRKFFQCLERYIQLFKPDLVIINPYTSYLGASVYDTPANTLFLRVCLASLLQRYEFAVLIIHHTPKLQGNREEKERLQQQYAGSGPADLTNWARATITIEPCEGQDGVFKFVFGKRWEETTLPSSEGIAHPSFFVCVRGCSGVHSKAFRCFR